MMLPKAKEKHDVNASIKFSMASDVKKSLYSQLRKILGTKTGDEAHHLLPIEFMEDELVQLGAKAGFHMNLLENGMNIFSKALGGAHGVHPNYNKQIREILEKFNKTKYTDKAAAEKLIDITNQIRDQVEKFIKDNPGKTIDDVILNIK